MKSIIEKIKLLEFPEYGDDRGRLVVVESGRNIPFEIKRIFYIYGSNNTIVRGNHANRKSEFVLINVSGSCRIKVIDGLGNERTYCLDKPYMGIYLPVLIWKEMYDFSADSVLLVLASAYYDETEYIRSIEELEREYKKYE